MGWRSLEVTPVVEAGATALDFEDYVAKVDPTAVAVTPFTVLAALASQLCGAEGLSLAG